MMSDLLPPGLPRELRISFGSPASGFYFSEAATIFNDELGYGWLASGRRRDVVRPYPADASRQGFVHGRSSSVFRVRVPPGRYLAMLCFGDPKGVPRAVRVSIAGSTVKQDLHTQKQQFAICALPVISADGVIDILIETIQSEADGWALATLEVQPQSSASHMRATPDEAPDPDDLWALPEESAVGPRTLLRDWRIDVVNRPAPQETGLSASDYLDLITGCVDHFRVFQDDSGAIIDPHRGVEFQYATPCFAYAAALVATRAGRPDLLEPAFAAYRFAAAALSARTAADKHEDFYPLPLAHAHALLVKHLSLDKASWLTSALLAEASQPLKTFDPVRTYRRPPGGAKRSGANWNCKALAGHWLLILQGLQQDTGYTATSLLRQGQWFDNEHGLYSEGPVTYDAFPRAWLADMVAHGYEGPAAAVLTEALWRGAISSLFMQSPAGELATGGRSSQHQWSDASQCVTFEWAAGRARAEGDEALCGIFKRAARRVILALRPWRRPSGEFWIVKNRVAPELRHGYESYSSHSQYNLLAATALGLAYELAESTDNVREAWTPAEAGRHTIQTGAGLDRVFATVEGTQVQIAVTPVQRQTPRGIIRVQLPGLPPQLPMTDAAPDSALFHLPDPQPSAISLGPAWPASDGDATDLNGNPIRSLAGMRLPRTATEVQRLTRSARGCFVSVNHVIPQYQGPAWINEAIEVESGVVTLTWTWSSDWLDGILLRFPVFAHDGDTPSDIVEESNGSAVHIRWGGAESRMQHLGEGLPMRIGTELWPFRCGWFKIVEIMSTKPSLTLRLT